MKKLFIFALVFALVAPFIQVGQAEEALTPSIEVTYPNGGEEWQAGETYEITWNQENVDSVYLDLVSSGGIVTVIDNITIDSAETQGSYSYTVPTTLNLDGEYKVKLTGYLIGVGSSIDESDDYFTILPATYDLIIENFAVSQFVGFGLPTEGPPLFSGMTLSFDVDIDNIGAEQSSSFFHGVKLKVEVADHVCEAQLSTEFPPGLISCMDRFSLDAGIYAATSTIDFDNQYEESNEDNNTATTTFTIVDADDEEEDEDDDDEAMEKVLVCHVTGNGSSHTLSIAEAALAAHLAHGDTEGACESVATSTPQIKVNRGLVNRLKGKILLQVEDHGEAWYVRPDNGKRMYMKDGAAAYGMMRNLSLGITNADLLQIPVGFENRFECADSDDDGLCDKLEEGLGTDPNDDDSDDDGFKDGEEVKSDHSPLGKNKLQYNNSLINRLRGQILLQVEGRGEAWYLNPDDGKRYYMPDGPAAYQIMRFLSLGITNEDLSGIPE